MGTVSHGTRVEETGRDLRPGSDTANSGVKELGPLSPAARAPFDAPSRGLQTLSSSLNASRAADILARRGLWSEAHALLRQVPVGPGDGDVPTPDETPPLSIRERYLADRRLLAIELRAELERVAPGSGVRLHEVTRWSLVALAIGGAALAMLLAGFALERDLSAGAVWTSSSAAKGTESHGSLTKRTIFDDFPAYFFRTKEEEKPRLDIDLGEERRVQALAIVNRHDCCLERSLDLDVLVSEDGKNYHRVRSRDPVSIFRRWRARFSPTKARYVRLELPYRGELALSDVRIYGS